MNNISKAYYNSPIGIIEIKGTEEGILSILFEEEIENNEGTVYVSEVVKDCLKQLDEYFTGRRKEFNVNYIFEGTDFQKKVWNALTSIPFGRTATYKDIAEAVGSPKAVRAVGSTNSKNLVSIIVPCHRVIGTNGKLTGYAGGLWRKEWLLNHEKKYSSSNEDNL
ncbi:methylated-DNA--[protein]-cysteine S-methyltransferase [Clostridium omnivorum]|uniref:Methylated-DNA--protein-cysteine methyltransferase n=1 Tax=Clostridium omnivorum TaxID=1604902 RepID=A0ABQ5N3X6_9CLOT|nr:methylated-DNA--[protein]-cysteine S-methyltransferase [Clostridium sp. E14]GLC29891.1 methylated-DNA--protein-cysteine methyltransferase [Clostridium sp. E14]